MTISPPPQNVLNEQCFKGERLYLSRGYTMHSHQLMGITLLIFHSDDLEYQEELT